jgi:predicted nucleotidyltransferase
MTVDLDPILEVLEASDDVEVAWLYGSRARGDAGPGSDFDLAVAFRTRASDPWERVDALRARLQERVSRQVSVIDINRVPTPLAVNVVDQGRVLLCRSDLRLRAEEARIWSLWEEYRREHERFRTTS